MEKIIFNMTTVFPYEARLVNPEEWNSDGEIHFVEWLDEQRLTINLTKISSTTIICIGARHTVSPKCRSIGIYPLRTVSRPVGPGSIVIMLILRLAAARA